MSKPRRTPSRRRNLFVDGQAAPLKDLRAKLSGGADRADGTSREPAGGGGKRQIKGEGLDLSDLEHLEAVACLGPLWDLANELESLWPPSPHGGRRREYHSMDALLSLTTAWACKTYRAAHRNLGDPLNWRRLRKAVKRAWRDHPERRLSRTPISRDQFGRFRTWLIEQGLLDGVERAVRDICVAGCRQIGALDPDAGSFSRPHPVQLVGGDGKWFPGPYRNNNPDAVNPATGKKRRYDPDASEYFHNDGTKASSPGYHVATLQTRTPNRQEVIILDTTVKNRHEPEPKSDATMTTDLVEELIHDHPGLREGLHGLVYDMALRSVDRDRLLDLGLHPISKIPLTPRGTAPSAPLGPRPFTLADETTQTIDVIAADGTPAIVVTDGNGDDQLVPLQRKTASRSRGTPHRVYVIWKIPDTDIVPKHLHNAITRIRHNSERAERETTPHTRRTRALSTIPPSEALFHSLYGTREDTESQNSQTKSELRDGRTREVGRDHIRCGLLGRAIRRLATALCAYQRRTRANLSNWFGKHRIRNSVNARAGPTTLAA